ncbi:MAG TPA: FAD/NAD(P)-binding oxidoreductase, partial [Clostridiales bacterium]|nr:FAD/NAD(P)-binding oxidoreductase [Clostridiales bacterium]
MINVKRLQKKLADTFGDRVHVELEGDLLRVTGELDTWQDILKACSLCATKKSKVHVVNDIVLKGAEPVPVRTPAVEDTALEGAAPDVLIIGGGITGCAIARELSKYNLDLL